MRLSLAPTEKSIIVTVFDAVPPVLRTNHPKTSPTALATSTKKEGLASLGLVNTATPFFLNSITPVTVVDFSALNRSVPVALAVIVAVPAETNVVELVEVWEKNPENAATGKSFPPGLSPEN